MRELRSEVIRFLSLPEMYFAFIPIGVLSLVFSVLNVDIFNAIVSGDLESQNLDPSLLNKPLSELMLEGYLGPVYQASIIFIPLALAFVFHMEYTNGDHEIILLSPGRILLRRISTLFCCSVWAVVASFIAAVVNFAASCALLAPVGRDALSIFDALIVYSRVAVFALLFASLTLFIGALTRRLFVTVGMLLVLLMASLSGILKVLSPMLHEALPLIGGKSFAFFDASEGFFTITQSVVLLICWTLACGFGYLLLSVWGRR